MRIRVVTIIALCIMINLVGCDRKKRSTIPDSDKVEKLNQDQDSTESSTPKDTTIGPKTTIDSTDNFALQIPLYLKTVYFEYDSYQLTHESKEMLSQAASFLKRAKNITLSIQGHCDERGSDDYNMSLGEKRAKVVIEYLKLAGISESRVEPVSFGDQNLANPNCMDDEECHSKNRRAVFVTIQK